MHLDAKGYIFDLDGTLAISQHFHFEAYRKVFAENNIIYTKEDDIALYAGQGSEKIFPHVFAKHDRSLTTEQVQQLIQRKRAIYKNLLETSDISPVAGIQQYLQKLEAEDKKIIVATGNRFAPSKTILEKTDLAHFFTKLVTIEDVTEPKPAPETFLLAMNELELEPEECIIFEDAVNGVKAAKAANMYCVAVTTGTPKDDLERAGADTVIDSYEELL